MKTQIQAIAFDCFGTLIDWEAGILDALAALFERHRVTDPPPAADLLRLYAELESKAQSGDYRPYRDVLEDVAAGFASRIGFPLPAMDRGILADSIRHWPAFPETADSLRRLKARHRVAVVSSIDEDLFGFAQQKLGLSGVGGLDALVTSGRVGASKPSAAHYRVLLEELGIGPGELLVAAASPSRDLAPAAELGIATCLVERSHHTPPRRPGSGGGVEPDLAVRSVAELADRLGC